MSSNNHQPLDSHLNGTFHPSLPPPPPSEPFRPSLAATTTTTTTTTTSSKRQRRPSVRLGDVGEQPASVIPVESYIRRCKQLNLPIPPNYLIQHRDPKTRPLHLLDGKSKRERRVKTNWGANDFKENEGNYCPSRSPRGEFGVGADYEDDEEVKGFKLEELSQEEKRDDDGVGDAPSETNDRNWSSVRTWLNGMGLGKYAPVFEIHEVDFDVLPLLTLEDLKDMGISAVGSRRKMYSAIQRFGKRLR